MGHLENLSSTQRGPQGKVIVVAGAHRSGTSVVAQALGWAGLYLGSDLKGPTRHNREGYFEDLDIIRFHEEILSINGAAWDAVESLQALRVPEQHRAKARELLAKFGGQAVWGWKDPRTALFLDFWDGLLPHAHWPMVVRRPAEAVASMMRRGDLWRHTRNPITRARMALRLWIHYNRQMLDFAQGHRRRVVFILTPDDFCPAQQEAVNRIVLHQWAMPLQPVDFASVYIPGLMKAKVPAWIATLVRAYQPADALYQEIVQFREALHKGYWGQKKGTSVPRFAAPEMRSRPVVCLITPREFSYSETFIRDHVRQLPAQVRVLYGGSRRGGTSAMAEASGLALLEMLVTRAYFPNRRGDGRGLVSMPGRGLDLIWKHIFKASRQPFSERALRKYLRRERVQAVLAEFGQTGAQVMGACSSAGVPLIVHFHGSDIYKQKWIDLYLPAYREMFAVAAAIIAVSQDMVERLAALGAPRDKLFNNPCGVDVNRFFGADPATAPPTFLAVGRFVEKKAPHLTLLAFKEVFDRHPQARLVMVGDGPLLEPCRQMAKALHIDRAVSYPGVRSHLEVATTMRSVRAYVQHSMRTSLGDAEGTPVSVLEAAASGLPVVSTRHGGIQEAVIDGETGYLVEESDIEGMAQCMGELVRSPSLAASLGQKARQHMRANYSMEKSIAALSEIIEWAIAN